jgi:membrane protease subunit HflK
MREFAAPGGKALWWLAGGVFVLWMFTGIYIVDPDEQGVVLRFGKYNRTVPPGPHYRIPFPIESVETPKVTQVQRVEVGFRSLARAGGQPQVRAIPEEAYTLTGDENIVNVQFSVRVYASSCTGRICGCPAPFARERNPTSTRCT